MNASSHHDKEAFLELLQKRGIRNAAVLRAMAEVPRESFVSPEQAVFAYEDSPLPIEAGQTISQPYIVALMTEALRLSPDDRVLEIGTGSGYAAAVLSRVAKEVYTVERHDSLANQARQRLQTLGYDNVAVHTGDGTLGWPEHAPYQGIVVTAASPEEPPRALIAQLGIGGRLVIPTGKKLGLQSLQCITRTTEKDLQIEDLGGVRFVPLLGEQGWRDSDGTAETTT